MTLKFYCLLETYKIVTVHWKLTLNCYFLLATYIKLLLIAGKCL